MTRRREPAQARVRGYRRGHSAELLAAGYLVATGHKILARRFKTHAGEIDLITLKRGRVGFVEVKRRGSIEDCEAAITGQLGRRVRDAADLWLARNVKYQGSDIGFDLVFVVPWRLPIVRRDTL